MATLSPLQRYRTAYKPELPRCLHELSLLSPSADDQSNYKPVIDPIKERFVLTSNQPILKFKKGETAPHKPLKVGVVFSGGQAPGGHNVIAGLFDALKILNPMNRLIGFCGGPSGLLKNQNLEITESILASYRNQGGFHLIGSGRTKIETPEQFEAAVATVSLLGLDGLVMIGGDDTNSSAAALAEHFKQKGLPICVVGVPKTIDGDLKNEFIEVSFGYDSACKVYGEIIGNTAMDTLSAKKYYHFVKLMGRSASHVTLECAMQVHPNLALIGEEIAARKINLQAIVTEIADMICLRSEHGKDYGVILIPEGIIEFIHGIDEEIQHFPEEIKKQLSLESDSYGNIQLSKVETERLLISLVEKELVQRKKSGIYSGKFSPQPMFCGYEGRSGLPSNFDCQYTNALGFVAALLLYSGGTGYMSCLKHLHKPVSDWEILGVPLTRMLHLETRKGKEVAAIEKGLVDLLGPLFVEFSKLRGAWLLEDDYVCPGPIQFDGPKELTDSPPLSLI